MSFKAAFADAGRGVGESGGVEIAFIPDVLTQFGSGSRLAVAHTVVSSGHETDLIFRKLCSNVFIGCHTAEARGVQTWSSVALRPGTDEERHSLL